MKNLFRKSLIWLALGIMMAIFQAIGMTLGLQIFPSQEMNEIAESGGSPLIFLLTCILNAGALYYFIEQSTLRGWKLAGTIFIIGFGLMYFMSQIETLWFNESVKFPIMGLYGIVLGGAIMFALLSIAATLITGKFKPGKEIEYTGSNFKDTRRHWVRITLLAAIIWPLIYMTAGYYIAWQFDAIRLYYSGSLAMDSYFFMLWENVSSGLYLFQIFRGFIWVFLAMLIINNMKGTLFQKGLAVALSFVMLCCSQLLLDNPFMPEAVRMGHLLETSVENAIWAIIIVWVIKGTSKSTVTDSKIAININ